MDSEARDAENVTGERYGFLLPDHSCGTVAALEEIFPMGKQLHSHQSMGSHPVFFRSKLGIWTFTDVALIKM